MMNPLEVLNRKVLSVRKSIDHPTSLREHSQKDASQQSDQIFSYGSIKSNKKSVLSFGS